MPLQKHAPRGEGRQRLEAIVMPVCQEQTCSVCKHLGIVCHQGKMQQHLVDFAVTVASDSDDFIGVCVEQLPRATGVLIFRDAVARPVIERVAQEENRPGGKSLRTLEKGLQRFRATVNVRENHQSGHNQFPFVGSEAVSRQDASSDTRSKELEPLFSDNSKYLTWIFRPAAFAC